MLLNKADIRYTFRLLAKKPAFTLLSILVLAGGLGISLIAFTMTYTLMFKTIPLPDGASIYRICYAEASTGCRPFNAFEFAQLRAGIGSLENVGIHYSQFQNLRVEDDFHSIIAVYTEWNMFDLSGTQALRGRTLQPADQEADAEAVVVLGHELWQRVFNLDESVLGTVINVGGTSARVVGIMPPDYRFPYATDLWLPVSQQQLQPLQEDRTEVEAHGRLKNGYSQVQASSEIAGLMKRVRQAFPPGAGRYYPNEFLRELADADTAHIQTLPMASLGGIETVAVIGFLNFLSACILLLSSINVGTLLLARTNERLKDVSIRVALGAPRTRLLLQTMGEGVCICLCGGLLGLLFAGAALELLNVFLVSTTGSGPSNTGFWMRFHLDAATMFAVLVFLGLAVLCTSVLPCWRIVNGNFNAVMRDGTRGALGLRAGRFSRALVLTAITLITLLMYIGSISYAQIAQVKGILRSTPSENMLGTNIFFDADRYDEAQRSVFFRSLTNALAQEQSISAVQISADFNSRSVIERLDNAGSSATGLATTPVTAVLFSREIMGVELLEGRHLDEQDRSGAPLVTLISKSIAEQLWPDKSAVGESISLLNNQPGSTGEIRRVVGITSEKVDMASRMSDQHPMVYVPLEQAAANFVEVRVTVPKVAPVDQGALMDEATDVVTRLINNLDPVLVFRVDSFERAQQTILRVIDGSTSLAIGVLIFALMVALAGIYGLTQNSVQLMSQEIGTRRALGATDRMIRNMVLWRGGRQVLIGFVIAMVLSSPLTVMLFFLIRSQEFAPVHLHVMLAMLGLYLVVYLAIYTPVRKLLLMEPGEALRYE